MFWTTILPILLSVVRHLLTAGGGALVATGVGDGSEPTTVMGAFTALIGAIWGAANKLGKG